MYDLYIKMFLEAQLIWLYKLEYCMKQLQGKVLTWLIIKLCKLYNKALKMLFVTKHIPYATKEHLCMHDLYINMFFEAQLMRLYK